MRRVVAYIGTMAVAVLMALGIGIGIGIGAAPASADDWGPIPSGVGWSGSWTFTSPTSLTVRLDTPGASMVAIGTRAKNNEFSYVVTVTDKLLFDGQCAYFRWGDDYGGMGVTCGTARYTIAPDVVAVQFQICTTPANGGLSGDACNMIYAPDLHQPWVFATGNTFNWAYYDSPDPYDWQAHLDVDSVEFDYFGVDNYGGPHRILISSYLTVTDGANTCGYADLTDYPTPLTSASLCGGDGTTELPDIVEPGPDVPIANICVWHPRARPVVDDCTFAEMWDTYGFPAL